MKTTKTKKYLGLALRIIPALIMLQTLYFKFTGAEESVYIFSAIGMEPWGRYLVGVTELVASVLLLSRLNYLGALIGAGAMAGAVFFHITILGIEVMNDGGYLFVLALITLLCCCIIVLQNQQKIKALLFFFKK